MQALLLADADMHRREKPLLDRLLVGLLDEGVRPTLAAPAATLTLEAPREEETLTARSGAAAEETGFVRLVEIEPYLLGLGERLEAWSVVERAGLEASAPGVVHAWGEGVWRLALRAAARLGWPCALEVWRPCPPSRLLAATRLWRRLEQRAPLWFAAADEALAQWAQQALAGREQVRTHATLWGAHAASTPLLRDGAPPPPCCALVCSGRDVEATVAAVEGFALAAKEDDDAMLFLDEEATSRSRAPWRRAKALQALGSVAMLPDAEANRVWTLRCPFVLSPDRMGERRSAALDAMGQGAVVLCSDAPQRPAWFVEGKTARCVEGASPRAWADALQSLWADADAAAALGKAAATFVRSERAMWGQVQATLALYAGAIHAAQEAAPS